MKYLVPTLALLALLAGAWIFRQPLGLPALAGSLGATEPAAQAVRKCSVGGQVVYTDGDCPAGSVPQALQADRVTVLPAAPRAAVPAASGTLPNARDLLVGPDQGALKARRMEQVIEQ